MVSVDALAVTGRGWRTILGRAGRLWVLEFSLGVGTEVLPSPATI